MKVYLRKMFNHDITHEVSVTETIISKFFEGERDNLIFVREGHEKGTRYPVLINSSTDARFGGQFKSIYKEDNVKEGDILAKLKNSSDAYEEIEKKLKNTRETNKAEDRKREIEIEKCKLQNIDYERLALINRQKLEIESLDEKYLQELLNTEKDIFRQQQEQLILEHFPALTSTNVEYYQN